MPIEKKPSFFPGVRSDLPPATNPIPPGSISAVTEAITQEGVARSVKDNELSNRISSISGGAPTSGGADSASILAAVNIVSNAVSVEATQRSVQDASILGRLENLESVVSVLSVGGGTASVTSNELSALGVRVSAVSIGVSNALSVANAASNAASVVASALAAETSNRLSQGNVISGAVNVVSARAASISAELVSLLQSASATLETHINTVSAAAKTASDAVSNELSARQSASAALETHINAVSGRAVSISAELASLVQIASAAATSADAHANTVSARAASISAELASLVQIASAAATSADGHANTVSARAASISAELASLLASVESRLSVRINGVGGSATPTSNAFSVLNANVKTVSDAVSNELSARQSASATLETHIKTVSARAVSISAEVVSLFQSASATLETHINTVSARAASISAEVASLAQIASAAATSVDGRVTSLEAVIASVSARSVTGSAKGGLQSVINIMSNRISAVSSNVSIVAANAATLSNSISALTHLRAFPGVTFEYTYSNTTTMADPGTGTVRFDSTTVASIANMAISRNAGGPGAPDINVFLSGLNDFLAAGIPCYIQYSAALNAGGLSVYWRIKITGSPTVNSTWLQFPCTVDNYSSGSGGTHTNGTAGAMVFHFADPNISDLKSADTALSVRIDTVSNATSVALSNAISNDASVSAAIVQGLSVQQGNGQCRVITGGAQTLSTGTFTKVSGLSLSLGLGNHYHVQGQINYTGVGGGSATAIFQLGMSATNAPVYAAFRFIGQPSGQNASSQISAIQFGGDQAISTTPSVMFSIKPGVSGVPYMVLFEGTIQGNAGAAAVLKVVAATSTLANAGCTIRLGSYIKAFRIA